MYVEIKVTFLLVLFLTSKNSAHTFFKGVAAELSGFAVISRTTKYCIFFLNSGVWRTEVIIIMEAIAKHDFNATADDELSFRKSQVLKVCLN